MKIGLVLSGGMAKGAFQIGALHALHKFVPLEEIEYLSCASIGVLDGYAFVTENLDRAENMWMSLCDNNARMLINQILRSSILQQNISNLYEKKYPLPKAFYCTLYDSIKMNVVYQNLSAVEDSDIPLYLKASVAMPVYNRAVQIGKTSYYDGAMIDNIPVFPLLQHDLDYIICMYFDDVAYRFESEAVDGKIIKLTFPCDSMLKQSLVFRKESIEDMIKKGYERTVQVLTPIFASGYNDVEGVLQAIAKENKDVQNKNLRITGDMLVTNLNKLTQRLTKRKIQ